MGDTPDTNRPLKREVIDDEYESTNNQPAAKIVKREEEPDPSFEVLELRQKVIELERKLTESQQNELKWKEKYERAVRSNAADGARMRHLENLDKKPVIAVKTEVDEEGTDPLDDPPSHMLIPSPHMNPSQCLPLPIADASNGSNAVALSRVAFAHAPPSQEIQQLQQAVAAAASNPHALAIPDPRSEKRKRRGTRRKSNTNAFVFVHNLSRMTSAEALENLFSQRFDVVIAKVAHECNLADLRSGSSSTLMSRAIVRFLSEVSRNSNPANPVPPASLGVVQLCSRDFVWDAVRTFQSTQLDGKSIVLTLDFDKGMLAGFETIRVEPQQLLVRNVPLQVTPSEVEFLFSSCIGFKSLHMPTNANGSHHGFGFIDFEFWDVNIEERERTLLAKSLKSANGEETSGSIGKGPRSDNPAPSSSKRRLL